MPASGDVPSGCSHEKHGYKRGSCAMNQERGNNGDGDVGLRAEVDVWCWSEELDCCYRRAKDNKVASSVSKALDPDVTCVLALSSSNNKQNNVFIVLTEYKNHPCFYGFKIKNQRGHGQKRKVQRDQ